MGPILKTNTKMAEAADARPSDRLDGATCTVSILTLLLLSSWPIFSEYKVDGISKSIASSKFLPKQ